MQEIQIKAANIKCNGCAATIKARLRGLGYPEVEA